MTDKKPEITNDVLIADMMLRLTAIEKLLLEKGVFTKEELASSTEEIAQRVTKVVLEKAQALRKTEDLLVGDKKDPAN